ncbi:MAG TPA: GNAT family N-acetyltransferase [Gaiellaceae bacterium]|nr:GNAT family N-acetyltransferase [Gaiellaceae bacterium]
MIRLRPLQIGDAGALHALVEATGVFTPEEIGVACELIDSGEDDDYRLLVAEDQGAVAGYVCWGRALFSDGSWDLYWIAVHPDRQRQGVGGALVAAAEADARAEAGRTMLVETASEPSYEPTRRFYERHGYAEVARLPDFYAVGDDKVIYAKRLDSA